MNLVLSGFTSCAICFTSSITLLTQLPRKSRKYMKGLGLFEIFVTTDIIFYRNR
jgi:hypothetical protein